MGLCLSRRGLANKKSPHRKPEGEWFRWQDHPWEKAAKTADHSPDRVSLLHKGGESIMAQRVRKPHRGTSSFVLRATPRPGGT